MGEDILALLVLINDNSAGINITDHDIPDSIGFRTYQ